MDTAQTLENVYALKGQNKPQSTTTNLNKVYLGVVGGNNGFKISTETSDFFWRSMVMDGTPNLMGGSSDCIVAEAQESGVFKGLITVGSLAHEPNHIEVNSGHKLALYAKLALVCIAKVVPHLAEVNIAASVTNKEMAEAVKSLRGRHRLIVDGANKYFVIDTVRCYAEGFGAITRVQRNRAAKGKASPTITGIDFGYGNVSIVLVGPDGRLMAFDSITPGVEALYEAIAKAVSKGSGKTIDHDQIRLGVEAQTFELGGYGGEDASFKAAYDAALSPWLTSRLDLLKAKHGALISQGAVKVCVGGGAMLPGLGDLLPKGWVIAQGNTQMLESQGLQQLIARTAND